MTKKELLVENWNLKHPIGSAVRYWKGAREGTGKEGVTWTEAQLMGGHTPVVFVRDAGAIALTHIEVIARTS